jgi:uncharacterized membrane-anchored protein
VTTDRRPTPAGDTGAAASKVAQVTLAFWIMKICATTLGETAGDQLSMTMHLGYGASTLVLLAAFAVTVVLQMGARRFHPALYWSVILTTSTAGTTLSDFMDRTLRLGYARGAALLAGTLVAVLVSWRASTGSLSVDSIRSRRSEAFYWAAILVSNTLGTALGDFLADDSGLGFLGGATLIGGGIALTALAWRITRLDRVALFWCAFVLTRPFGATFGDLLTKPVAAGGLDLGTAAASVVLAVPLVALVAWSSWRSRRAEPA